MKKVSCSFISLLLALLLFGFLAPAAQAATASVSNWSGLQTAISTATEPTTITVTTSFSAIGGAITIPAGTDITLVGATGAEIITQPATGQRHFIVQGTLTLQNVTLDGANNAVIGGGVDVYGTLTMQAGSQLSSNRAVGSGNGSLGGGIHVFPGGSFTMAGGLISQNAAAWAGGGVLVDGGTMTMSGGQIIGNTANSSGGGIEMRNGAILTMTGGIISQNTSTTAVSVGGGVELKSSYFTMSGGQIMQNRTVYGGGVHADTNSTFTMTGGQIINNTATGNGGGIFSTDNSYANPIPNPANHYRNLIIGPAAVFSGNVAGNGARRPPSNALATSISQTTTSIFEHALNNYDINYYASGSMVTYLTVIFTVAPGTPVPGVPAVQLVSASGSPRAPTYAMRPTPPANYGFIGWRASGTGPLLSGAEVLQTPILDDTTYVAQYAAPITLTFDAQGGVFADSSFIQTVFPVVVTTTYSTAFSQIANPTQTGSTFRGWFTAPDGDASGVQILPTTIITTLVDQTLYARWTALPTVTLTFIAPYGTPYSQVVPGKIVGDTFVTTLASLAEPVRAYYTFAGWSTALSGGSLLSDGSIVPGVDTTYYAQWTPPAPVQVTFDAVDGDPVLQAQLATPGQTYAAAFAAVQTPTRPYYSFAGWFTQPFGGFPVSASTIVTQTEDHILYAQWIPPGAITVTFDAQGGVPALQSATVLPGDYYLDAFMIVTDPIYPGHTFLGWFTASAGGARVFETNIITQLTSHTLYAHWTQIPPPGSGNGSGSGGGGSGGASGGDPGDDTSGDVFHPDFPPPETHFAYLIGVGDGMIAPAGSLTRAETATVLLRLLADEPRSNFWTLENPFPDVPNNGGAWFSNAVAVVNTAGLMTGMPDGNFHPYRSITRAEVVTILVRKLDENVRFEGTSDLFSDIAGHWARDAINLAGQLGWITGYADGSFQPNAGITRAEFAAIVNRMFDRTAADIRTADMHIWTDNLDQNRWYYWPMQIASNAEPNAPYRNWAALQLPNARPEDVYGP
ncbi:MAG: InlB B-repeat-containing protein [Oscillospiraceae bacterium]|nr:InlB B-repeat-containing protein [Oscillospiraceae bacterium]